MIARLLICVLLLIAAPAVAVVDQFVVIFLDDDRSRAMAGYSVAAGVDSITGALPLTPSLDAIALAGFAHANIKTSAVCSPSRARLLDYGPVGNPQNPYGRTVVPEDPDTTVQVELGFHNFAREAKADGWNTAFFGKWHISNYKFLNDGVTAVKQAGFDEAQAVLVGNPTNEIPGIDYDDSATIGDVWADCQGHKFFPYTDIDGTITWTHTHSSKVIFDAVDTYMTAAAATGSGKYLIFVETSAPHIPQETGEGGAVECNGNTETQNDYPPGESFDAGETKNDVYLANIEYIDTRMGTLITDHILSDNGYTDHMVVSLTDNGTQGSISLMAECDASPGKKNTPYICGTTSHFVAAGPGIIANEHLTNRLNSIDDIPATLLSLMGSKSTTPWGLDFSDCMTQENSQSAASCRHTRDSVTWAEWKELGGSDGTLTRPPRLTDANGVWTNYEVASEVWLEGGAHVILHRIYDPSNSMNFVKESLYPVDDGEDGGALGGMYSTEDTVWDVVAGGEIAEDGTDWDITATDAAKAALVRAHRDLDHQWDRDGAPTPTLGGGSF